MKTVKFITAFVTISLVLFMSVSTVANSIAKNKGEMAKSGNKNEIASVATEMDLSYLRFDVTRYVSPYVEEEMMNNSLDYLRFDLNDYISVSNEVELPLENEFDYLRFDSGNFASDNSDEIIELPANEFDYLRFDLNKYTFQNSPEKVELPETE